MKDKGEVVKEILQALKELGPMTGAEISAAIGYGQRRTHGVLQRLRITLTRKPKRIHVVGYTYDNEGQRNYPRAIFDLGDLPDAPKPKANQHRVAKTYRDNKKLKVNSVWMLGMTRNEKRSSMRSITKTGFAQSTEKQIGAHKV